MDYRIILPENCNQHEALEKLLLLSKEDPQYISIIIINQNEIHD